MKLKNMYLKNKFDSIKKIFSKKQLQLFKFDKNIDHQYKKLKSKKKLILIVQQGRSGSRWLINIFKSHNKEFMGATTRDKLYESFYHFCSHNKIEIDQKPFMLNLKSRILQDWKKSKTSIICSPYFIFNLEKIIKEIRPDKFILCINDPIFTANSFLNKNFYIEDYIYSKKLNTLGLQPFQNDDITRFFGRITPTGRDLKKWIKLSRLAKVGWYMNETMVSIYKALKKQKKNKIFIFNLIRCDQNYDFYLSLRKIFQINKKLSRKEFLKLKKNYEITPPSDLKINNFDNTKWKKKDYDQFLKQTKFFRNFYKKTTVYLKGSKKII